MDLKKKLEKLSINVEESIMRFGGNEGLYQKFLIKFRDNDTTFSLLKQAVKNKDEQEIEIQAHTLKGISGNLGFANLMKECSDLVSEVRFFAPVSDEKLSELYSKIELEYNKIIECLKLL